jgi:hypothetical protein
LREPFKANELNLAWPPNDSSADFPAIRYGRENLVALSGRTLSWAESRRSLHLQTKWARLQKADAQGHDPVFFRVHLQRRSAVSPK